MVMGFWGRSHARRACPPRAVDVADLEAPAAPPIARCARCDTPVIMAGGKLPKGWVEVDGEAFCPDDAPKASTPAKSRCGTVATAQRHVAIGPLGITYSGCRIYHEHAAGFVGLRIHGGARPPRRGRDEPAHFMLDRKGLDALIRHLCDVRKDMPNG